MGEGGVQPKCHVSLLSTYEHNFIIEMKIGSGGYGTMSPKATWGRVGLKSIKKCDVLFE